MWYARIEKFEYGLVALKAATMEFIIDSKAGKIKLKHAEARKFKNQKDRDEQCELCWQRPRRCIKEYNNLKFAITACAVCKKNNSYEENAFACAEWQIITACTEETCKGTIGTLSDMCFT